MSEKKPITIAMNLVALTDECFGEYLGAHDLRRHEELKEVMFSCVYKKLNKEKKRLGSYKKNSGSNSKESIDWLINRFYKFYLKSGKTLEVFPSYYLACFLKNLELNVVGKLFHPVYEESVDWKTIDAELNMVLAPDNFVNDTKFVGVKTHDGQWRIGYVDNEQSNDNKPSNCVEVYVPSLGYNLYDKACVSRERVFMLTAEQRRLLINALTRNDKEMFLKYAVVFKRKPIEAEYKLFLYHKNRNQYVSVRQWFIHEFESLEENEQ